LPAAGEYFALSWAVLPGREKGNVAVSAIESAKPGKEGSATSRLPHDRGKGEKCDAQSQAFQKGGTSTVNQVAVRRCSWERE